MVIVFLNMSSWLVEPLAYEFSNLSFEKLGTKYLFIV